MNSSATSPVPALRTSAATAADISLEVLVVPLADVDRAKGFYGGLGWRVDADFTTDNGWRVVQLAPFGSSCSIVFGHGIATAVPGSVQGLFLIVDDIEASRAPELQRDGIDGMFEVDGGLDATGTNGPMPGRYSTRQSVASPASFSNLDDGRGMVDESNAGLAGRGLGSDVASLTDLLREAEVRHDDYRGGAAEQHWSDWYAPYVIARQRGRTRESAAEAADSHVKGASS